MTPIKPKGRWCDRNLLRSPVFYCLVTSPEAFERELKRLELPRAYWPDLLGSKWADATTHKIEFKGRPVAIVAIANFKGRAKVDVYGLLIHEALHIWQWIEEILGEVHSPEMEAYSVQTIAQELMRSFDEQTRRKR